MTINWTDVLDTADEGYQPIPENKYLVRIIESELVSASSGKPMIKLTLAVVGGPYDTRQVWTNIVFPQPGEPMKPGAMRMLSKRLAAFGLSREYLTTHNPSPSQIAETIMGMSADAKVIQKPYQDEMRNDVDMFFLPGGGSTVPAAPTVAGAPPVPVVPSEEEVAPTAPPAVAEVPAEAPEQPELPTEVVPTPPVAPVAPVTPPLPGGPGPDEAPF